MEKRSYVDVENVTGIEFECGNCNAAVFTRIGLLPQLCPQCRTTFAVPFGLKDVVENFSNSLDWLRRLNEERAKGHKSPRVYLRVGNDAEKGS